MDVREGKGKDGGKPSEAQAVAGAESKPTRDRKPYQKPAFQFERVFETMALSCGKVNLDQLDCRSHPSSS
jgi:hypothetical protein